MQTGGFKFFCCEVCDRNPTCGVDCGSCDVSVTVGEMAKKASGENIEEWQRNTVRVRVPKEPAEKLAKRWRVSVAEAVVRAVQEAATDE